jgi:hypothetical protein
MFVVTEAPVKVYKKSLKIRKGVTRCRKSKKDIYNSLKKKDKRANNNLQNAT